MSRLIYNGIEISIQKVWTFDMRDVYTDDHAEYLYTHYLIEVQGVINPQATSFLPGVPGDQRPQQQLGQTAGTTMIAIRHLLLQPRGVLTYDLGNDRVLESPQRFRNVLDNTIVRAKTDAKNGPHPIDCKIAEFHGTKTLVITFKIETFIKECVYSKIPSADGSLVNAWTSPVLAHRWEMSESFDELFLSTRVINGWAVFRSDGLLNPFGPGFPLSPDDFRARMFHPIPDNFKRTHVDVAVSEDGLECRYQIVDEEQTLNISPTSGIAKMQVRYYRSVDWSITASPPSLPVGGSDPLDLAWLANVGISFVGGLLPSQVEGLHVQLWGKRNTSQQILVNSIIKVFQNVYNVPLVNFVSPFHRSDFQMDLVNRYAELRHEYTASGYVGNTFGLGAVFLPLKGAMGAPGLSFTWPDERADDLGIATHKDGPNIAPPGDLISRSQSRGRLVAQSLMGECGIPAQPFGPGITIDSQKQIFETPRI